MDLRAIANEALHLPMEDRAELAQKLLLSLDEPSSEEVEQEWLAEARRRAKEVDAGMVQLVPAETVRERARKLLG